MSKVSLLQSFYKMPAICRIEYKKTERARSRKSGNPLGVDFIQIDDFIGLTPKVSGRLGRKFA